MTRFLYPKFILGYLVFGLLGLIAIATFSSKMTCDYLVRSKADTLYDETDIVASSCSTIYQGKWPDSEGVSIQIWALFRYLGTEIWVINRQGTVIVGSLDGPGIQSSINGFDLAPAGNRSYTIGNCHGMFSENVPSMSVSIIGNYDAYGYVLTHLPTSEINQSQNGILSILYITSTVLFGLPLVILLVFTQTVYLPLRKTTVDISEYTAGNPDYRIDVKTHDEIGYFSDTLNYMSDKLDKVREYRKNFIANVPRNFRSPLTPIREYLGAILDGTIPAEMHEEYLSRVIPETERLHKLAESMFILNLLDARSYLPGINFDINHTTKDTATSFEGTCESRNTSFNFTLPDDIRVAFADFRKTQQAMYNLIDNATEFSHHDSIIYIQAPGWYEKIFVSIKGTGIDISKDSLKKIWERSYKADLSRDKDKKGTGLGPSIVKEVVQAHDENINVVSTEGVGTEFIFSLPRSTNLQKMSVTSDLRSLWERFPVYKCFIIS